ncbi:MAG: hypothetical protein MI807_14030 [Verrucomicrobiales bacterium]|nr:hypothetical protein [Verrucomicrobiales bacterium]
MKSIIPTSPLLFSLALLLSGKLAAGEFLVTNTEDDGAGSLRDAIAQCEAEEENTIRFEAALNGQTIAVESGEIRQTIQNGGSLTITAADLPDGITLDAQGSSRVLRFDGSDGFIELIHLTITGGQAPHGGSAMSDGGGVKSGSLIRAEDCTFTGNRAGDGSDGHRRAGSGGAILAASDITVLNCTFRDNHAGNALIQGDVGSIAGGDGGAIFVSSTGTTTVSDCLFENNSAGRGSETDSPASRAGYGGSGGAVHAGHNTTQVSSSLFRNNRAGSGGINTSSGDGGIGGAAGAITAAHTQVMITDSVFLGNFSGDGGSSNGGESGNSGEAGAVRVFGLANALIQRCIFDRNQLGVPGAVVNGGTPGSLQEGAAVYVEVGDENSLFIENCVVSRSEGIGVYSQGGVSQAVHCTFAGNRSNTGAALTSGFANQTAAINCLFTDNRNGETPAHFGSIGTGMILADPGEFVREEPSVDLATNPVAPDGRHAATNFGIPFPGSSAIDTAPENIFAPADDLRGNLREDGARDFGAVEVSYQVDNRIGKRSNPATHRGNDVYSAVAAVQQEKIKLRGNRKRSRYVSIENDGDLDHLRLRGGRGGGKLKTKTYRLSGGRRNVTGACRGAGYLAENVPGQSKVVFKVQARAKRRRNPRRFNRNVDYQLTSASDATLIDRVRARVKYRP